MMQSIKQDFAAVAAARLIDRIGEPLRGVFSGNAGETVDAIADIIRQAQAEMPDEREQQIRELVAAARTAHLWLKEARSQRFLTVEDLETVLDEVSPIDELERTLAPFKDVL